MMVMASMAGLSRFCIFIFLNLFVCLLATACQSAAMNSKLSGHHTKLPVKVEHAVNPFVVDKSDLWDRVNKVSGDGRLKKLFLEHIEVVTVFFPSSTVECNR